MARKVELFAIYDYHAEEMIFASSLKKAKAYKKGRDEKNLIKHRSWSFCTECDIPITCRLKKFSLELTSEGVVDALNGHLALEMVE